MNEIYKTPESNLIEQDSNISNPHGFWKFFFWLNIVCLPLFMLALFILEPLGVLDWIDLTIFSITLIAMRGYSYSRKFFSKAIWGLFYKLYLLWVIFYNVIAAHVLKVPQYGEIAVLDLFVTIDIFFVGLTIYLIYLYAFKSSKLWES